MNLRHLQRLDRRSLRLLTLLGSLVLVGCSSGMADLQAYVEDVKNRPGPPLDPLPVMQPFVVFEYSPEGLRDPFSVPKAEDESESSSGLRPDPERRKELLESFPLDGLDMVGTLGEGESLIALVIDPDQVVHRVKVGNYLGQNDGRIVAINDSRIDLVELVPDGAGGWLERQASVSLEDEQ